MRTSLAGIWRLFVFLSITLGFVAQGALAGDTSEARIRNCPDTDWCTYNRADNGWSFSPLTQINKSNVQKLRPAWIHQPGRSTHGIQSNPLVLDGSLYYSTAYSRVHKLNAATGERIWHSYPELNEMVVKRQTHGPYSRGLCVGDGRVYMGTLDGRLQALDDTTGKKLWEDQLVDSVKDTIGFTGGCTYAEGKVVIGQQAGEWPIRGRIFAVNGTDGKVAWTFYTVGGPEDPEAQATWGGDSWKYGGGGGWQPGGYDAENHQVLWGTGNPNPLYDWGAENWQTTGARPGKNLYVTSVVALNMNTGKLNWYHQELPHDPYDWDSAVGEMVQINKDGKKLLVHPSKNGFVYVYDRKTGALQNIYPWIKSYNFVERIDPKTNELVGQFWPHEGKEEYLCPAIMGGNTWHPGTYNPQTGLYYRVAGEWCIYLTVQRTEPITEPSAALIIGADFRAANPPDPADKHKEGKDPMHGVLYARDPVTGDVAWSRRYTEVPQSSIMSTGGGLVFVGTAMGWVEALDASTGAPLWKFNNGAPHAGGITSYAVDGKQYIAVTTGKGSLIMDGYDGQWPDTYGKQGFEYTSTLVVFSLPFAQP